MEATLNEIDIAAIEPGSAAEAALVQACREGDQTAFNLLVWRWEKPLFNFTYKYIGDAHLAQDLVQETFIRVLKSIHRYEHRGALSTWIYQIAVNLCRDHCRRKKLPTISLQDSYTTAGGGDQIYVHDRVPASLVSTTTHGSACTTTSARRPNCSKTAFPTSWCRRAWPTSARPLRATTAPPGCWIGWSPTIRTTETTASRVGHRAAVPTSFSGRGAPVRRR